MKDTILQLLKEASSSYLSGEEMAGMLNISRTSVWKNIKSLQRAGYSVEGSPRRGYRLTGTPDLLYAAEVSEGLHTEIIAPSPKFIHHFLQVDSTNEQLKKLAEEGAPEGTVVVTEEQTAGKGRLGRSWSSPPGKGACFSVLLRPVKPLEELSVITLLTAVAVVGAIKKHLPHIPAGIKWPNDILIGGSKVCGILTELKAEADRLHYLITGIGVNINCTRDDFPPELKKIATSLRLENGGTPLSRKEITRAILREMDIIYREYLQKGTKRILEQWRAHNLTLGKIVTIKNLNEEFSGEAMDIDRSGALLIAAPGGEKRRFVAGEIMPD